MIDNAAVFMAQGVQIAAERKEGVNDNMSASHFHGFFEIYFLEEGSREYVVDGTLYHVEAMTAVLLPPNILHYSYGGPDKRFNRIVVYFREGALPPELFKRICQHNGVYAVENKEERAQLVMLLHALLKEEERSDSMHLLAQQDILELIVILLLRLTSSKVEPVNTGKIRKIVRYLNDHYVDDINLDDLAAHFFISKYHLCREFKKYTQNTIVEYLNFVRIIHAQRLFMESSDNISEIAQAVGFSSLTHFERVFSKLTGQRPNERRREILKSKGLGKKLSEPGTNLPAADAAVKAPALSHDSGHKP